MKRFNPSKFSPFPLEEIQQIRGQLYQKKVPRYLFLLLCLNLIIAPAMQAATGNEVSRNQAYALGILGIVTVAFSIYLFVVMFQPERF
jgi:K+-transporting ATPase KdpF subunit